MDKWIVENPRVTAYILYLSALIIVLLVAFLYYYHRSQEYMSMVDRKLMSERVARERREEKRRQANKPLGENEDPDFEDEEEGGFQILVDADD